MLDIIPSFLVAIRVFFRSRSESALEVLALRQQVAGCGRAIPTPASPRGRAFRVVFAIGLENRRKDRIPAEPFRIRRLIGSGKKPCGKREIFLP